MTSNQPLALTQVIHFVLVRILNFNTAINKKHLKEGYDDLISHFFNTIAFYLLDMTATPFHMIQLYRGKSKGSVK